MILVMIGDRFQAFGKQVQGLYCPRNGKREKRSTQATAPQVTRAREGGAASLASPETGREAIPTTTGVGEDAREGRYASLFRRRYRRGFHRSSPGPGRRRRHHGDPFS